MVLGWKLWLILYFFRKGVICLTIFIFFKVENHWLFQFFSQHKNNLSHLSCIWSSSPRFMWASHDDDSYETGKFGQCSSRLLYMDIKSVLSCRPPFCCCWIFQVACSHYPPGDSQDCIFHFSYGPNTTLYGGSERHTVKIMSIFTSQAYTQNPRG